MKSDYYLNDQELQGHFKGLLSHRLGLAGPATKEVFNDLCDNINPNTGDSLTQRMADNRRIGYDINFHCPKSVSIVHALSKDDHIMEAFNKSVHDTMLDIEADSKVRVRKNGKQEDRETGELIFAEFVHQTARPVDGSVCDPHLHTHAFVFNVSFDKVEGIYKAGQFGDIKRDMPYYQARFHKRLADNLIEKGYRIRRTDKSFEIEGVPQQAIDLFSKRTDEIGRVAKEKGITDVRELDKLGAKTRSKKQKGVTMAELKKQWRDQLKEIGANDQRGDGNKAIRYAQEKEPVNLSPEHCIDHAIRHRFERASVMHDRRILETAYRHSLGVNTVSIDQITAAFQKDRRILHVTDRDMVVCTTKEVLAEEKRMVDLANQGKGKLKPLYTHEPAINLKGEQFEAVRHVLTTPHRVSIIKGRAGTGKTKLMEEAVNLINKSGHHVTVVAPTSQASRGVLRQEGFDKAETVAKLLIDKELQQALEGQVLWVDEAGLLGTKDMTALLDLATKKNARVIFSGDTRQHSSVERGDALRILNTVAGIKSAEVSRIYRQKNKEYRAAVQDLSDGKVKTAFDKLDALESIKTIDPLKPNESLVDDYVAVIKKGKSALVISPTHQQGESVTQEIRQRLRKAKLIGKKEIKATRLANLNLTKAEKNDARNYKPGHILQFSQNIKGIRRGSTWVVLSANDGTLKISNDEGKSIDLPMDHNKNFEVFQKTEIALSKGDKIRVTRNGFDANKKRLDNGQIMEVVSVRKNGNIKLRNTISKANYAITKDHGHVAHAHCITSHASQGKTVDEVFISQPAATFPATDMKQFYVSVSRGRERVRIYTDDKVSLLEHASELGHRQSAMELLGKPKAQSDYIADILRHQDKQRQTHSPSKEVNRSEPFKPKQYEREPEI